MQKFLLIFNYVIQIFSYGTGAMLLMSVFRQIRETQSVHFLMLFSGLGALAFPHLLKIILTTLGVTAIVDPTMVQSF